LVGGEARILVDPEQDMAVWLITGATGFVGRHVLGVLKRGVDETPRSENTLMVLGRRPPPDWPDEGFVASDLNDANQLGATIRKIAPDVVIHTAGRTPPASDDELYRGNFWATIHLLNALRSARRPARVVLSGSAAELGLVDAAELPVNETHPCNPIDAYGRSKWLGTVGGLSERSPLEVMVARVFNPIGPGTPTSQAFGRFAARLSEPGPDPLELGVGNLDARRDFIDVRDVAGAMIALALRGRPGLVYNVGTGQSRPVGDGLGHLMQLSGRSVKVTADPSLRRRCEPGDSRADINRIAAHTGWRPAISWEQSLADLWSEACAVNRPDHWNQEAAA
jgi:GDP-4-dehydro-6-deoxy-D-mannose reductase